MADLRDYFNTRATQAEDLEARSGVSSKFDAVQQASQEKINFLSKLKEARTITEAANEVSVVGRLGLDPDGTLGTAVNTAVASVAALTGQDEAVATNVNDYKPASVQRRVGDVGVSLLKGAIAVPEMAVGMASLVSGGQAGKILNDAGFRPEEAKAFLDTLYSHEQQAANADVHGADGFWNTMSQMADNPSTVPHALLESLFPMLAGGVAAKGLQALGVATKAATAMGEGTVMMGSAAEQIRNQTEDGRLNLKQALSAATTGLMGAGVARLGMAASSKVGLGDIDEAIVNGTLGKSKNGALVNAAGSGAFEAGEEGLQSTGEVGLQNFALDRELTDGMGNAAAIGMVTGATMGAPMGLAQSTNEKALIKQREAVDAATFQTAVEANDTAIFLDEAAPTYNPAKAVAVLHANSQLPTATPETKVANLDQATEIVTNLDDKIKAGWNELFKLEEAGATDKTELKAKEMELVKQERDLAEARKTKDSLVSMNTSVADIKDMVAAADATIDVTNATAVETSRAAVDSLINLSMQMPGAVSQEEASQLAENMGNSLTDTQRTYLRSFSEAQVASNLLKSMDDVSQEIYHGSEPGAARRNIGITQYQAEIGEAIATGSQKKAMNSLSNLTKFATDHQNKASTIAEAYAQFQKTGEAVQIVSDGKQGWSINTGKVLTERELRNAAGLTIKANSVKLVRNTPVEADAISKAAAAMKQAIDLKFNTASVTPAVQATASPTPAASVPSATPTPATPQADTATEVEATAGTSGVGEAQGISKEEAKPVDSAPPKEVTSPAPLKDRTDENSGSTLRSTETVEDTAPQAPTEEITTTGLNVLGQKSAENTPYQKRHLLADYFTQVMHREGDATKRPLVAVKDFLGKWLGKEVSFRGYVTEPKGGFNEKHFKVLQLFQKKAMEWAPVIKANLFKREGQEDYWFKDLMQFMVQGEGKDLDLEENVKTAMSFAGFSWIAENAMRGAMNTDEEINLILGRDEDHKITDAERSTLAYVGTRQNVVSNALGQRVIQALGLKASKDAPKDLMPRLESALGAHVMKMLMDKEILVRNTLSGQDMAQLMGQTTSSDVANVSHQFLSLARDTEGNLNQQAEEIAQASKSTHGILEKLFSVEAGLKEPSMEPIPFIQKKTKNTNQDIPEVLAKVMAHENAVANYVRDDTLQLVGQLDKQLFLAMAGAEEITAQTHVTKRKSIQAKNDALEREFDRFMEFYNSMEDKSAGMYFEHSVWLQQRVGIATNMINPQSSKIHRHLLYRKAWETKVDMTDAAQMDNFRLRVAEGLGIKTDKQGNEQSLKAINLLVQNPLINDAVAVLQKAIFEGGITAEQQQTLLAGVYAGKENMHSLDALISLARYEHAKAAGDTSFTIQMMGEVDGVTNGPMLSHLLLGAANSVEDMFALLNRGGFYEEGNTENQYNLWRGVAGHLDLYEQTALHIHQTVQAIITKDPRIAKTLDAIYAFTGELADKTSSVTKDGRNIVKTPLTAMVFGSSLKSSVDSMTDKFIESIYSKIEQIDSEEKRVSLIKRLNTLGAGIPANTSAADLLNLEFKGRQLKNIQGAFKESLGKAVETTMKFDFEAFIAQRKKFNLAAQMTFELYNAAYTGMHTAYVTELIASGELPVNSKGVPLHELTTAQEAVLRKRLEKMAPVMHSAMSKQSGSLKAGLYMGKSARKLNQTPAYSGEIKFGKPFNDNGAKTTTTHAYETVASNPGVAMLPVSTHSFDSSVMHGSIGDTEVLNVHDAKGVGIGGFQQAAQSLNKAVWDGMMEYSPASELFDALTRTMQGVATLVQEGTVPQGVIDNLTQVVEAFAAKQEMAPEQVLANILFDTKELAFLADDMKYQALSQMASIDQYALQGGNYQVTQEQREAANNKRSELTREVTPQLREVAEQITAVLSGKLATKVESKPDQELDATPPKAKTVDTPFGKLGKSRIESDSELVNLLAQNPQMPVRDVLKALIQKLKDSTETGDQFKVHLASQLYRNLENSTLTVNYVTPGTQVTDVLKLGAKGSMGWYVSSEKGEAIYALSPEFQASGLTTELLLHEILHGVLARTIQTEMNAKAPDSESYKLIQDLEALRAKAIAHVGKDSKYAEALVNVHEFVSWGMTNLDFQRDVLNNISMQSKTKKNVLVTGMKAFINTITGILFKDSAKSTQAKTVDGMAILISNVAGLLNQAAQNAAPQDMTLSQINTASYTTQSLYDALGIGSVDPIFSDHLQNLLGTIVEKLHGPFGSFKEQFMSSAAGTPLDMLSKAIATGVAPFASKVQASGLKISDQELFALEQVEATIQVALSDEIAPARAAYRELAKLYREARATFKPTDFADPADYDFIFKMEATNGKTDHLARFAALGLTHQEFNKLLQRPTAIKSTRLVDTKTFSEWLQYIFDNLLEMFNTRVTATYEGQQADVKLSNLVGQLVDIEAKRRIAVERKKHQANYAAMADEKLGQGLGVVASKLEQFGRSAYFKNHKNSLVKAAGSLSSMVLGNRQALFMQGLSDMRDKMNAGAPGLAAGLLNTVRGEKESAQEWLRASKNRDKHTIHVKTQTSYFALGGFINEGNDLTDTEKESISAVLLRTGVHNLLGKFSMVEITSMLDDKMVLQKRIDDEVIKLNAFPKFIHYFVHQAKILGYYRATEETKGKMLMMNAGNIARLYGTPYASRISEAEATEAESGLSVLVTLYGLLYSDTTETADVLRVLSKENARIDGNGIESLLHLHKDLDQQSMDRLFAGNEPLASHGYMPEVYNPHIDVVVANVAVEGQDLINQGYAEGGFVMQDPTDPDQSQKAIYVMRDGGAQPLLTGAMAYQDLSSKGTGKHTGNTNQNTLAGTNNSLMVQNIAAAKLPDIMQMFKANPMFNPALVAGNFASPVFNNKGEIANWRYMMSKRTKNKILERDNRFDKLLGQLAGSIYDKETVTANNTKVVQGLHDMFTQEFAQQTYSFINVGPNSPDMAMREIYRLLPKATRDMVEQVWGRDGMMVRKDTLDIVFGYHKYSAANMFDKNPDDRNYFEQAFTFVIEFALETYVMALNKTRVAKGLTPHDPQKYIRRAAMVIRKAERVWQEVVKEMKDIIVVKTGTVMLANVFSNFLLLKMNGVPMKDMLRDSLIAARGAKEYQRDNDKLFQLETQVESGYVTGNLAEVEREIVRLKDALARNPVRGLIDAGLMPTIAEDVDATEDSYSYKSALVHKTEAFTSKLNPKIVELGKMVYMSKDTRVYRVLAETTQLSDFVARYAFHQYLTTRQKNPLTSEEAIQKASDAFVNYDIPMHRMMTYSDDMGLTMFSKYFLRVQRVIMKLAQEHPGNVLATMLMTNYLVDVPNILESSPLNRLGNNPFNAGAFGYPATLDELATLNAGLGLFK